MSLLATVTSTNAKWKKLSEDKIKAGLKAVNRGALKIHATIIRSFVTSKSGRTYQRGTIKHIASAPGEAPARDTGFLGQSILFVLVPVTVDDRYKEAKVMATAPYALALEFGREDKTITARPFMRPAFNNNIEAIRQDIKNALSGS